MESIDGLAGRTVGTGRCGMNAIGAVRERGALARIKRVGRDGVGGIKFDHRRRARRGCDVGALIAAGVLIA